jgi:outer membrane protein TolC
MGRRRRASWQLPVLLTLAWSGLSGQARSDPPPRVKEIQPGPSALRLSATQETDIRGLNPLPSAPTPVGPGAGVKPVVDETQRGVPINLSAALQLAGVSPLDIAAATIEVQQGLAVLLQAKVLWLPNLNAGVDYARHDGVQQNIFLGGLFQLDRQSFFVGGGPSLFVALTDAIYEPLAQRRVVASRVANVQTARNDVLLSVSRAYFVLQEARGRLLGVEATIVRAQKLVELAVGLAPALIAPLEINRSKAELQSLKQSREIAIRDWIVASAALAEILLLDPETLLEPVEPPFVQVTLIPGDPTAAELVPIAINNRPEIASQRELLAAANQRLKQEKKRPFLPSLIMTSNSTTTGLLAAGNLSAGPNAGLGANAPAANFEVAAVWQLQNVGVGNIGRIRQRKAEQNLASIEVTRILFRVRAEVAQALARVQTARARIGQTDEGLRQAIESADKNFVGLRETTRPAGELLRLVVRPQEVVAALIALNAAFEQYSAAVNEYNAAQFDLYRALGNPAQWVTSHPTQVSLTPHDPRLDPTPAPATPPVPPVGPNRDVDR